MKQAIDKEREKQGIEAILFLQKKFFKKGAWDRPWARKGWRSMSQHEQDFLMKFYKAAANGKIK